MARLVEGAPFGLFVIDSVGQIRWANAGILRQFGYTLDEVVGTNVLDHVDPAWNPLGIESVAAAMEGKGLRRPMLFRAVRRDGSTFIAEVTANSQLDDPVVEGLLVYVRRWDERYLLDRVLEAVAGDGDLDEAMALLVEVMGAETLESDGMVVLEPRDGRPGRCVASPALPPELVRIDDPALPSRDAIETGQQRATRVDQLPARLADPAAAAGYLWCWAWPVPGPDGVDACLVLWRRQDESDDLTCRVRLESLVGLTGLVLARDRSARQLAFAAAHDPLTSLANRTRFYEALGEALEEGSDDGALVGVLYVDLDGFKPVNDRLGHGAGDRVLQVVAARLAAAVREGDLVARLGGDEFTVLCTGVADPDVVAAIGDRLVAAMAEPIQVGGESTRVGASVGIAVTARGAVSGDGLVDAADAALYQVKSTRKGGWILRELPAPA